jgi:hypothetical protein
MTHHLPSRPYGNLEKLLLIPVLFLMVSCGSPPSLEGITRVSFSPKVDISRGMMWPRENYSNAEFWAPLGAMAAASHAGPAAIGYAAGTSAAKDRKKEPETFEQWVGTQNNEPMRLWFESELLRCLKLRLEQRGHFTIVSKPPVHATIEVSAWNWGFFPSLIGSSRKLGTLASVEIIMRDMAGSEIWSEGAGDTKRSLMSERFVDRDILLKNPALMRKLLTDCADNIATLIAKELPIKKTL